MSLKKLGVIISSFFVLAMLFLPMVSLAIEPTDGTGPYLGLEYGRATGLGREDIRYTIARIISVALGILGILATVLVIYAGFTWMTAGGNEESAGKARKILYSAVIGLLIILSAYSLTRYVMQELFRATTGMDYGGQINDTP